MSTRFADGLMVVIAGDEYEVMHARTDPHSTETQFLINDRSALQWVEARAATLKLAEGKPPICRVHLFENRDDRDLARGLDLSKRTAYDVAAIDENGADTKLVVIEGGRASLRDRRDVAVAS